MSPLATFCDAGRSLTLESLMKAVSSNFPYASFLVEVPAREPVTREEELCPSISSCVSFSIIDERGSFNHSLT